MYTSEDIATICDADRFATNHVTRDKVTIAQLEEAHRTNQSAAAFA